MEWECQECGMINERAGRSCAKCGTAFRERLVDKVYEVDVAHNGEDWSGAKEKIDRAISHVLKLRIKQLRIVHGYGSGPGHSSIIHDKAINYLTQCARRHHAKLLSVGQNRGAHVLDFG